MKDYQLPSHIAELINERSEELIGEFFEHKDEYINKNPNETDSSIIFQGWAIQKIAGLQCLVESLLYRVSELESGN